jgi:hypothetical protein
MRLTVQIRTVIVVLAASTAAAIGIVRLVASPDDSAVTVESTVDDLTARVATAGWTSMDHDMSGDATGYQMPPAMMPGMPADGDQRMTVSVTVVNTSDETRLVRPDEEFVLRAEAEDGRWKPHSDTFGDLPRLAPHNAVTGVLYFDVPPEKFRSPAWLEWTHDGTATRLFIPLDGTKAPPTHSHNP